MRVLLTGGSGFVGSAIAVELRDSGQEVVVTDLAPPTVTGNIGAVRFRGLDVRDRVAVRRVFDEVRPDVVVHAAAVTHSPEVEERDPARFVDVNVIGSVAVLEAIRESRPMPKLVHLSSGAVYGDGGRGSRSPQPEAGPLHPVNLYGVSKHTAEQIVGRYAALHGLRATLLRPAKVFGPGEHPTAARTVLSVPHRLGAAVALGSTVRVTPRSLDATGDWVSVGDVARAARYAAEGVLGAGQVYNVGSGRLTGFAELARSAERWAGRTLLDVVDHDADLDLDPDARHGMDDAYDIAAITATGWRATPVLDSFTAYLRWAAEHPETFVVEPSMTSYVDHD